VALTPAVGIVAGLLLAVYPPHIYLAGVFYAEGLLIFWGLFGLWLAARTQRGGHGWPAALATGWVLGVATLTRSTVALWVPCVMLAWVWAGRAEWRRWAGLGAVLALGSALVVVPWGLRNRAVFGKFIPVSSGFGYIFWQANNPVSTGQHSDWNLNPSHPLWHAGVANLPEPERTAVRDFYAEVEQRIGGSPATIDDYALVADGILFPLGLRYALTHPGQTVQRAAVRLRSVYSAFSWTVTTNEHTATFYRVVAAVTYYPILGLALVGMVWGWRERRTLGMIYLAIGVVTVMTGLLTGTQTRYRLPLDPLLILFASLAVVRLYSVLQSRARREAV
jgi:4-amino-4-deoxy-L-arabinose transferase-like glycosyltransferase